MESVLDAWIRAESVRIGRRILSPFTWEEISQDVELFKQELRSAGVSAEIAEELLNTMRSLWGLARRGE